MRVADSWSFGEPGLYIMNRSRNSDYFHASPSATEFFSLDRFESRLNDVHRCFQLVDNAIAISTYSLQQTDGTSAAENPSLLAQRPTPPFQAPATLSHPDWSYTPPFQPSCQTRTALPGRHLGPMIRARFWCLGRHSRCWRPINLVSNRCHPGIRTKSAHLCTSVTRDW